MNNINFLSSIVKPRLGKNLAEDLPKFHFILHLSKPYKMYSMHPIRRDLPQIIDLDFLKDDIIFGLSPQTRPNK